MLRKSKYSKEVLAQKADTGDNDALALLLVLMSTGVFGVERRGEEDRDWMIVDRPPIDSTLEEYHHFLELFKSRIKDMTDNKLQAYYNAFAGSSFNSFFILEEMASRGIPFGYSSIAYLYEEGCGVNGIFRDKEKAREFFRKAIAAGDSFSENALKGKEIDWIYEEHYAKDQSYSIRISGPADILDTIMREVSNLPSSDEDSTPLSALFKSLVGYGDYPGRFVSVLRNNDEVMFHIITRRRSDHFALAYAIEQKYPEITVDRDYLRKQ